jgi:RimJ/RimL family protein N-acetyltransferase
MRSNDSLGLGDNRGLGLHTPQDYQVGRLKIEPFKDSDLDEIRTLCEKHGERRLRSHKKYLDGERKNWFAWVVRDDDEIVGFTAYNPFVEEMDSVTVINRICRGKGIAELLLLTKVNHARSLGIHRYITTIGGTNHASINLVLKVGFTLVRAEDREYGSILVFEKELNR